MTIPLKIKIFFFRAVAKVIRKIHLYNYFNFVDDKRPNASFKLVFFCGKSGIEYLNASLFSVYHCWQFLPDILIVSDGTPISFIKKKLVKWPRNVSIISCEECANYYKNKNNNDMYEYASKELWGKKLSAVLYCAEHFSCLYSDTDVLWYSSPWEKDTLVKPFFKMGQDIEACYSNLMLKQLQEEGCLEVPPLNAGVIYANGDPSIFHKWEDICTYLSSNADNRSEQTTFAILNNHFNKNQFWSKEEILIETDDIYSLNYTKRYYPFIVARHYAGIKNVTFWRDFIYMYMLRNKQTR